MFISKKACNEDIGQLFIEELIVYYTKIHKAPPFNLKYQPLRLSGLVQQTAPLTPLRKQGRHLMQIVSNRDNPPGKAFKSTSNSRLLNFLTRLLSIE